jgi:hypothetical protein
LLNWKKQSFPPKVRRNIRRTGWLSFLKLLKQISLTESPRRFRAIVGAGKEGELFELLFSGSLANPKIKFMD